MLRKLTLQISRAMMDYVIKGSGQLFIQKIKKEVEGHLGCFHN
jgi:hypothetical protein